jgi:hypothetical protein
MNRQLIFDVVLFGMRAQGRPSMNNGTCLYRGKGGDRCAVGMWISDSAYSPEMEEKGVGSLVTGAYRNGWTLPSWFAEQTTFLAALQNAHDTAASQAILYGDTRGFLAIFEETMKEVARRHDLIYYPPSVSLSEEAEDTYHELKNAQRAAFSPCSRRYHALSYEVPTEVLVGAYSEMD